MKALEIGKDYAGIFGTPAGCKMIYNGGNSWTGIKPDGGEKMMESEKQTINEHTLQPFSFEENSSIVLHPIQQQW